MANGDVASAAGIFTPVSSGADFRVGYDDINRLADVVAKGQGYNAWSLSPITLNSALWNALQDPNGATSGTLAGGAKVAGAFLVLSFRATYIGSTITSDTKSNITDMTLGTLAVGYRPAAVRYFTFALPGTSQGSARVGPDGVIQIVSLDANNTIPSGTQAQIDAVVPL